MYRIRALVNYEQWLIELKSELNVSRFKQVTIEVADALITDLEVSRQYGTARADSTISIRNSKI